VQNQDHPKRLTLGIPPFKVTQGHWNADRSATYNFLLVFHRKYGHISHHFQDKGQ